MMHVWLVWSFCDEMHKDVRRGVLLFFVHGACVLACASQEGACVWGF